MDKVARMPAEDRQDIFSEAAAGLGSDQQSSRKTSGSASPETSVPEIAVRKIPRLQGRDIAFEGARADRAFFRRHRPGPRLETHRLRRRASRTRCKTSLRIRKQDQFNKKINRLAADYIASTLCPELDELLRKESIGLSASVDPDDPHVVNIRYPAAFAEAYIRPEVRLEIGPLASWVPSARHVIQPYAFDVLPEVFENPAFEVVAIAAERTFWEKATILHQEAHRTTPIPQRYSRHYYDLYKLAVSRVRAVALADPKLRADVVAFEQRFYPSAWARYDLAVPGSFRLLPATPSHVKDLAHDYEEMQVMLFGAPPEFGAILDELRNSRPRLMQRLKRTSWDAPNPRGTRPAAPRASYWCLHRNTLSRT